MLTLFCSSCEGIKPSQDFCKDKSKATGFKSRCKSCDRVYYVKNQAQLAEKARLRYATNPLLVKAIHGASCERNIEKVRERKRRYVRENTDKVCAINSNRRARKLQALPKWLSKQQIAEMAELYAITKMLKREVGEVWQVDHIVPLSGKTVCGLHVPWNLQLLSPTDNARKNNLYWPDKP